MNIETSLLFAYKNYYKLPLPEVKRARQWFAKEQLELSEGESRKYADAGQSHFSSKEEEECFGHWYYINFIAVQRGKGWNVEVYNPPITKIKGISISPVRMYEEEGEICCRKCDQDFADMWSVYVQTGKGEFCIADCKDEDIALKFAVLIRNVIKNIGTIP